jgi:hypothetical protein
MSSVKNAVGFRVKSGWTLAVVMNVSGKSVKLVDRRVLQLSDPSTPDTKQPYHVIETLSGSAAEKEIERLNKIVFRIGTKAVSSYLQEHKKKGISLKASGIVVGSDVDPAKIGSLHVRAHALEGRLFRTVVEDSVKDFGLTPLIVTEKLIYLQAVKMLRLKEMEIKNQLKEAGEAFDGPWRAEEKTAFLAAWMSIA